MFLHVSSQCVYQASSLSNLTRHNLTLRCHSTCLNLQYDIAEAVTGVSIWRTRFYPMVDHVGAVVDEVEFRQVYSHHLGFSPANALYTPVFEGMAQWHHVWLCSCITKLLNLTPLLKIILSLMNVPVLIFCEYFIMVLAVKLLILSSNKLESVDSPNVTIFNPQLWFNKQYTGGPPYLQVIRSKTYCGYVKPRIIL